MVVIGRAGLATMVAVGALALLLLPAVAPCAAQGVSAPTSANGLPQADLEEMVGPIALYPDLLLANVLAASVFPDDVVAAQAMRSRGGDPVEQGDDGWDESVRFVASFPDVLAMLAEYDDWTAALGEAYLVQPGDVMDAIQALRTKAWDNGALRTNEQQVVVQEGPTIIIEPANPQVIFVPVYSPSVVFVRRPVAPAVIGFGVGVAVGAIWSSSVHCNWGGRCVAWGPGWWSSSRTRINVNVNNNVNINTGGGVNRPNRPSRPGGRPGADGSPWRPDRSNIPSISGRPGAGGGAGGAAAGGGRRPSLDDFRGIGGGAGSGRLPSRNPGLPSAGGPTAGGGNVTGGGGARPSIPSAGSPGGTARPNPPQVRPPNRPAAPGAGIQRPGGGSAGAIGGSSGRPSVSRPSGGGGVSRPAGGASRPTGAPTARPSAPSRGSAFQPGGGGARPSAGGGARPSGGGGSGGGRLGGAGGR